MKGEVHLKDAVTSIARRVRLAALVVELGALGAAVLFSQQAADEFPGVISGVVADQSGAVRIRWR